MYVCPVLSCLCAFVFVETYSQDKKISRSQRRLEEGGQGVMAMDTASLRKNEEIMAMEVQVKEGRK